MFSFKSSSPVSFDKNHKSYDCHEVKAIWFLESREWKSVDHNAIYAIDYTDASKKNIANKLTICQTIIMLNALDLSAQAEKQQKTKSDSGSMAKIGTV